MEQQDGVEGGPKTQPGAAMQMTARRRRELAREARKLKPLLQLGRAGLSERVLEQARRLLRDHRLLKVRVAAADREEARRLASDLAARVPCEFVGLTGYVAVLYCAASEGSLKP